MNSGLASWWPQFEIVTTLGAAAMTGAKYRAAANATKRVVNLGMSIPGELYVEPE
jgi:hypothetical protein